MSVAFREDHDALLARADALERENRELRARVAEQDRSTTVEADNAALRDTVADLRAKVERLEHKDEASRARRKRAGKSAVHTRVARHGPRRGPDLHTRAELGIYGALALLAFIMIGGLLRAC